MAERREREHVRIFERIKNRIQNSNASERKAIVFSIGENCLTDDVLKRNGLKSFSSPYASSRSNVEYVLAFEEERFRDFLNPEFLREEEAFGKAVVRNKKYVAVKNTYHSSCTNGFEFTHHNVLSDDKARETFERRCQRLLDLEGYDITLVYHHRMCEQTDEKLLGRHLAQLARIYANKKNRVRIFAFTQVLVEDPSERRAVKYKQGEICFYRFYTLHEWGGNDQDFFWARADDDLLQFMVEDIKNLSRRKHE